MSVCGFPCAIKDSSLECILPNKVSSYWQVTMEMFFSDVTLVSHIFSKNDELLFMFVSQLVKIH